MLFIFIRILNLILDYLRIIIRNTSSSVSVAYTYIHIYI